MILIKAKVKETKCKCCGHIERKTITPEKLGCDTCKKPIEENTRLDVTVFWNNPDKSENFYFDSWECTIKKLKTIKTDYFISLPFLHYDTVKGRVKAKDFFKLLK